jgi:ERCC4-type nuclease
MDAVTTPFTVKIDQQEKKPWEFTGYTVTRIRRGKKIAVPLKVESTTGYMKTADYSLSGYEGSFLIERKSAQDLIKTISCHRDRFKRELKRMSMVPYSYVIVEENWDDVLRTCRDTCKYNPVSLDSTILSMQLRYPTQWLFRPSRRTAAKTAYKLMDLFWRKYRHEPFRTVDIETGRPRNKEQRS